MIEDDPTIRKLINQHCYELREQEIETNEKAIKELLNGVGIKIDEDKISNYNYCADLVDYVNSLGYTIVYYIDFYNTTDNTSKTIHTFTLYKHETEIAKRTIEFNYTY